jgi:hypothetical protein
MEKYGLIVLLAIVSGVLSMPAHASSPVVHDGMLCGIAGSIHAVTFSAKEDIEVPEVIKRIANRFAETVNRINEKVNGFVDRAHEMIRSAIDQIEEWKRRYTD